MVLDAMSERDVLIALLLVVGVFGLLMFLRHVG